jgi:hypothetical protein
VDFVLSAVLVSSRIETLLTQARPTLRSVIALFIDTIIGVFTREYVCGNSSRDLALVVMATQAMLIDWLLRIVSSNGSYSFYTVSVVTAELEYASNLLSSDIACYANASVYDDWNAFSRLLRSKISAGKPFLKPLSIPTGPPI